MAFVGGAVMTKAFVVGIAVALLLTLPASAACEPVAYAADEALLHDVLTAMDLEYAVAWNDDGDPFWTVSQAAIVFTIAAYDRQSAGKYASLLFYAGWETSLQPSLVTINAWNMTSRFGRAYIDEAGDPAIELDLLLTGGVTSQTIREYILIFVSALSDLGIALGL